ncbi:peptidase families S8 and S53 domain protein [Verrucomicrobiia bacterium DG1235]|nr:peptidase families S8 and S53 domain protein [Verrucomicrobiae bacterium DG1235]
MKAHLPQRLRRAFGLSLIVLSAVALLILRSDTQPQSIQVETDGQNRVDQDASDASSAGLASSHATLPWTKVSGPPPTLRFFKDEPQALQVDPKKIAVKITDTAAGVDLTQNTIPGSSAIEHPLPGWRYLELGSLWETAANSGWSETDFSRTLVEAATSHPGVEYAAPVFLDFRGDPLLPQQALLIGLSPETTEEQALSLASLKGNFSHYEFLGANRRDLYLEYPARNGFEIVELAADLSQLPEFNYAEPDMFLTGRIPASTPLAIVEPEGADLDLGQGYKPDPSLEDAQWGESLISMPNDPLLSDSGGWGLVNSTLSGFDMHALEAWDYTTGSSSVIAVVIDNGIEPNHPDLNQWTGNGKDFTPESGINPQGGPVTSNDNHGTAVAGYISGKMNNGIGAAGIAPGVQVASARPHYNGQPNGSFSTSYSWVVNAINWTETIGAKVTVNSNSYGSVSSSVSSAYSNTRSAGITHFASAGNGGHGSISFPSSASAVMSVGASQRTGSKSSFSQYGSGLEFLAPGTAVTTTDRTGSSGYSSSDYATVNGTSFSAPYASGVAALLHSYNSSITPAEVESAMRNGCEDMGTSGYDTTNGYGHLSARNALELIGISISSATANSKVRLTWTDPANSGMANSIIYIRCSTSGFPASSSDGTEIYTGTASEYEHTGLTPGQTYYYTFWGNDGSSYANFGTSVQTSVEAVGTVIPMFLENSNTRYVAKWMIDSPGTRAAGGLAHTSPMSANWTIKTTADMNGDGVKDLVLENTSTRLVSKWLMNEYGERVSGGLVHSSPMGTGWSVAGAADLNGDGIDDLLLENSNSRLISKWLLNSSGVRASGGLVHGSPLSSGWTVAGTADLNGDDIDDVLLQNTSTGYVSKWLINSSGVRSSGGLVHSSPMSSGWSIAGTADLNGDGIEDVLLQNLNTGYVSKWLINSSGVRSSGGLVHSSPMSSGWAITAIGDLNGDDIDDVILHNSGTQLVSKWVINSSGVRSAGGLVHGSAMSENWEIAAYGK